MEYRRCWNCVRNREYPIAGAWRDSKVPLIHVLVGSWFEGCQTYESAVAEDDGVTISPVASDDEQVFILQHEAMCVFFRVCFLNSYVRKEVKKISSFMVLWIGLNFVSLVKVFWDSPLWLKGKVLYITGLLDYCQKILRWEGTLKKTYSCFYKDCTEFIEGLSCQQETLILKHNAGQLRDYVLCVGSSF